MNEMESTRRQRSSADRLIHRLVELLPRSMSEDDSETAYDEAGARRLGAREARKALDAFRNLPNMDAAVVNEAQETFERWEKESLDTLSDLDSATEDESLMLRHRRAEALSRLAANDALHELVKTGLLPEQLSDPAAEKLRTRIGTDESS
jgi:hypothetical protein